MNNCCSRHANKKNVELDGKYGEEERKIQETKEHMANMRNCVCVYMLMFACENSAHSRTSVLAIK